MITLKEYDSIEETKNIPSEIDFEIRACIVWANATLHRLQEVYAALDVAVYEVNAIIEASLRCA